MDKLEKVVKGKNVKALKDAFFDNYIKVMLNGAHTEEYIESPLQSPIDACSALIKIPKGSDINRFVRILLCLGIDGNGCFNDTDEPGGRRVINFLDGLDVHIILGDGQVIERKLGTYVNVCNGYVQVNEVANESLNLRASEVINPEGQPSIPSAGAVVRLFIGPLLTSDAFSSIVYNALVSGGSEYNMILGQRNIHIGKNSVCMVGEENVSCEEDRKIVINKANTTGRSITHATSVVVGEENRNYRKGSILFGVGHDNYELTPGERVVAFGKFSDIKNDTAVVVGNGTDEYTRRNLFEITRAGIGYIYKEYGYRDDGVSRILTEEDLSYIQDQINQLDRRVRNIGG